MLLIIYNNCRLIGLFWVDFTAAEKANRRLLCHPIVILL